MRRGVCKNILYSHALELIKNRKVVVIDVREEEELERQKALDGSISIPVNDLPRKIRQIVPDRKQPILVYCATGSRSIFACQILADLGYQMVYNLQGGLRF